MRSIINLREDMSAGSIRSLEIYHQWSKACARTEEATLRSLLDTVAGVSVAREEQARRESSVNTVIEDPKKGQIQSPEPFELESSQIRASIDATQSRKARRFADQLFSRPK